MKSKCVQTILKFAISRGDFFCFHRLVGEENDSSLTTGSGKNNNFTAKNRKSCKIHRKKFTLVLTGKFL